MFYIFTKVIHSIYTLAVIIAPVYGQAKGKCDYRTDKFKGYICSNIDVIPQAPLSYYVPVIAVVSSNSFRFQEGDLDRYRDTLEVLWFDEVNLGKQSIRPDKFFNLDKLRYIYFINCSLTDRFAWKLPPYTFLYNVSFNSYTQLDVTTCPGISTVAAIGNKLQKLPKMTQPYLIQNLILNKNPMNNLVIEDIAPLCQLKKIELILSDDSLLAKKDHYCQCSRLDAGRSSFKIAGFIKGCYTGSDKPTCQFDDLANLRSRSCPGDEVPDVEPKKLPVEYFLIGLGIVFALLLILALPLIIYKYISAQKISETIPSGGEMDQTVEEETVNEVQEESEIIEEEE